MLQGAEQEGQLLQWDQPLESVWAKDACMPPVHQMWRRAGEPPHGPLGEYGTHVKGAAGGNIPDLGPLKNPQKPPRRV